LKNIFIPKRKNNRDGGDAMDKFLDLFNLPRHFKNYLIMRKIAKYSGTNGHNSWVLLVDLLIGALLTAAVYYLYFINRDPQVQKAGFAVCVVFLLFFVIKFTVFVKKQEPKYDGIKTLILKDDEGRNVKAWSLEAKTALLIGKKTRDNEVDLDLSDTDYATLVSKEHAVLNFSDQCWYIEDLGSTNGSGVHRPRNNAKVKLEMGQPFKLCSGDVIYIANLKILVK
jgi:hypothetical protein